MDRLNPAHPDAIFGYVRCHVRPNPTDRIGLLPEHKNNKLIFDLTDVVFRRCIRFFPSFRFLFHTQEKRHVAFHILC